MATRKKKVGEEWFVVMDSQRCCFVDTDTEQNEQAQPSEICFQFEQDAIGAATDAISDSNFDSDDVLTVYRLVPVAKVKKAKAVVEKL